MTAFVRLGCGFPHICAPKNCAVCRWVREQKEREKTADFIAEKLGECDTVGAVVSDVEAPDTT